MEALLETAKSLPAVKQRVVAAIVGSLVADAASKNNKINIMHRERVHLVMAFKV